jgi:PIN domain nuclease of toxin-antitoxin system
LPIRALELIRDAQNEVYVSAVSIWEIAIKRAARKRSAPAFSSAEATRLFRESNYILLGITPEHAGEVETLPLIHNDPFDRLLIAQALSEPLRLVTCDRKLAAYSDSVMVL